MSAFPSSEIEALATGKAFERIAPCLVSEWAIRAWCAAIGIDLSHFTCAQGRLIAPPPMLQCWAGSGLTVEHGGETMHARVRAAFLRAGFPAVVATDYEQEYLGALQPGDTVRERVWIEAVSSEKHTSLGRGHFVTICFEFMTLAERAIGRLRVRTLYFDPAASRAPDERNAPARLGDLPVVTIPVTPTLVIAGSIASNDFEPVHHDRDVALMQGLDDIILSIVTTTGLIWRYALAHVPAARINGVRLRLGAPAFPGDSLCLTGQRIPDGEGVTGIRIAGDTRRGRHVIATVSITE